MTLAILACVAMLQIAAIGTAAPARRSSPKKSARHAASVRVRPARRHAKHTKRHVGHHNPPPAGGGGKKTSPISGPLPEPIGETVPPVGPAPPSGPPAEAAAPPPSPPLEETPTAEEARAVPSSSNPFVGLPLYVEPSSPARQTVNEWAAEGRTSEAHAIEQIAVRPVAKWFGDWTYGHGGTRGDVDWWVGQAAAGKSLPLLVAYDLPWRDCSLYSSGGAANAAAYRKFIDEMAAGIGARTAAVILEPDALSELSCLGSEEQAAYYSLLSYAVKTLGHRATTTVYLDAGNAGWQPAQTMAARLKLADVADARGFSLNISSFGASASEAAYGRAIDSALGTSAHFVIDTSRNGQGPPPGGEWCNPPGRGLGTPPTAKTSEAAIDAYLWVKHPGTSDGTCNGGPSAGTWWPTQALELARNSAG